MGIKWGVLGTAGIAEGCTIPGMLQAQECELYAIAGRNPQKVKDFQDRFGFAKAYVGYEALLQDDEVQAIYIPLPNKLHCEWVLKAIKAGKHVLCEKPLALNAKEAQEMYEAAKEQGVILAEAFAYLHSPYIQALKEDVLSGVIGEIDYIETAFLGQAYKDDIRMCKELGGGSMYDLGCYCTSMILSLVDAEPTAVRASAEMNEEGIDMLTTGILKFENGVRATFHIGMVLGIESGSRLDRLYIHGSKGIIRSEVEYNQAGELTYTILSNGQKLERRITVKQNYMLEIEQMNRAIMGLEKPHITPEFSIKNAQLIDRVLHAIDY